MSLDPVTALLDIGSKVIDRIFPDPAQKAAAQLELVKLQTSGELQIISGQLAINQVEASSASVFVSGWRPAVGWVCASACAWNWIGLPMAKFVCTAIGHPIDFSPADLSEMLPILMGMLGLGGLRTIEKLNDKARQ